MPTLLFVAFTVRVPESNKELEVVPEEEIEAVEEPEVVQESEIDV